jgi:hypothetical protein
VKASPEFEFLVECCRGAFEPGRPPTATSLEWPLFMRLVRFHRVQGLVWNTLRNPENHVPQGVHDEMTPDATAIVASNLRLAAECQRLKTAFGDHGIAVMFVKGLTLGTLAYGTIATKAGVDIDLLVDPQQLGDAAALLQGDGYRLAEPAEPVTPPRLAKWHRIRKESTWIQAHKCFQVDLHTCLADNPALIPAIGLNSPTQMVEISPGISLSTLADDELFAYLAVHGASSAWFRLKWITDFAALMAGKSPAELDRLYERSQQLGAGRAPAQAMLLADMLYGSLKGAEALKARLEADRRARWLATIALRQVAGRAEPVEPTSRPLGTAAIHYSQLLMLPGLGFKLAETMRQARAVFA